MSAVAGLRALVVEPVSGGVELVARLAAAGARVVVSAADPATLPARARPGGVEVVAWSPVDPVADLVQRVPADAVDVVLAGHEYAVVAAAEVAAALGLAGLAPGAARAARHKDAMRAAVAAAGLACPASVVVPPGATTSPVGYPCVVKPVDCGGSLDVRLAEDDAGFADALHRIVDRASVPLLRAPRHQALAEAYVEGPELSVEGIVAAGRPVFFSCTEKLLSPPPVFVELGHVVRSPVLGPGDHAAVHAYVEAVLGAVGIDVGPFHAEVRITPDGPVLMEVAARLAGDHLCELIGDATGVDYFEATALAPLGHVPDPPPCRTEPGDDVWGIGFFATGTDAVFERLVGADALERCPELRAVEVTARPGDALPGMTSYESRFGHAVFAGSYARVRWALTSLCPRVRPA